MANIKVDLDDDNDRRKEDYLNVILEWALFVSSLLKNIQELQVVKGFRVFVPIWRERRAIPHPDMNPNDINKAVNHPLHTLLSLRYHHLNCLLFIGYSECHGFDNFNLLFAKNDRQITTAISRQSSSKVKHNNYGDTTGGWSLLPYSWIYDYTYDYGTSYQHNGW